MATKSPVIFPQTENLVKCEKSYEEYLKLDMDGSSLSKPRQAGAGSVIRDSSENCLVGF